MDVFGLMPESDMKAQITSGSFVQPLWALIPKYLSSQDTHCGEIPHKYIIGGDSVQFVNLFGVVGPECLPKHKIHCVKHSTNIGSLWMLRPYFWCPFPTDGLSISCKGQIKSTVYAFILRHAVIIQS